MPDSAVCIIGIAGAKVCSESSSTVSKLFFAVWTGSPVEDADSAGGSRGQKGIRWLSHSGEPYSSPPLLHPLRRFGLTSCTLAHPRCHGPTAVQPCSTLARVTLGFGLRTTVICLDCGCLLPLPANVYLKPPRLGRRRARIGSSSPLRLECGITESRPSARAGCAWRDCKDLGMHGPSVPNGPRHALLSGAPVASLLLLRLAFAFGGVGAAERGGDGGPI